jgi:hypothetical protein
MYFVDVKAFAKYLHTRREMKTKFLFSAKPWPCLSVSKHTKNGKATTAQDIYIRVQNYVQKCSTWGNPFSCLLRATSF